MFKGKKTCKILKEIRAQIAKENDILYITSECKHQGDCPGTCPKCEAEVRYLEKELEKRAKLGKAVTVAGLATAMLFTALPATACQSEGPAIVTNGDDLKLSTFTPNFIASLAKSVRTEQLQQALGRSDAYGIPRSRMLDFWEDYFVCFEGNTDYYRLYHPEDENVSKTRQSRLLAVTYDDQGALTDVTVTSKEHTAQPLASPDLLPRTPLQCTITLLQQTVAKLDYTPRATRALLQEWWADAYLGTHEFLKDVDIYRLSDGTKLWLRFTESGMSTLDFGEVEQSSAYSIWLMQNITPQVLADQQKAGNAVAWINGILSNPRKSFLDYWCFSYSAYHTEGDFFIGMDENAIYYSLSPLNDTLRSRYTKVDALAITFDKDGKVVSITPLRMPAAAAELKILPLEEYFATTTSIGKIEHIVEQTIEFSTTSEQAAGAMLKEAWQANLKQIDEDYSLVHQYSVTAGTRTYLLWVLFKQNGALDSLSTSDPNEPTGGDSPAGESPVEDPWDVTPRDE